MSINLTLTIALAIVCHAWIGRIQGPPRLINVVAWAVAAITLLIIVFGHFR